MALQLSASIPAFPSEDRRDAVKTTLRWTLSVGLALTSGLTGFGHTAVAAASETGPAITIHVRNYAGVEPKILTEAEEVATGIFRKAGLDTRWADTVLTAENDQANSADHPGFTLTDIQVSIFQHVMSDQSGLPNNVMGLAPGTGPDRGIVYVFGSNVEARFWMLVIAHCSGRMDRHVSMAQILGHAIAHEIGHLLLNQQVHSPRGIMRGEWGFADFRDMTCRMLLFTPQQAEFLRADVRRRNTQQETLKVAELESPAPAR
jgi:hypothetical protein